MFVISGFVFEYLLNQSPQPFFGGLEVRCSMIICWLLGLANTEWGIDLVAIILVPIMFSLISQYLLDWMSQPFSRGLKVCCSIIVC